MSPQKTNQYQAYSLATRTVPKTRQVVMLYDGAIRYMRQAREAIIEKRIEDRFNLLLKASKIVVGLRGSIDFDNGGQIAHVLSRFYTDIDVRILGINFKKTGGVEACDSIIEDLKKMRDTWDQIDRNLSPAAAEKPAPAAANDGVTLSV